MIVKLASQMINEIRSDQIETYDSVLITGDIVCSGEIFLCKIKFNKCIIKGDIRVSNCSFKDELSFIDTYFEGNILFNNVIFEKASRFNNCQLGSYSLAYINRNRKMFEIEKSLFKDEANFSSDFCLIAGFKEVTFEKNASFHGAKFFLSVLFIKCIFMNNADYMFSEFKGDTLFDKVKFFNDADFEEARFGNDMGFEYSLANNNRLEHGIFKKFAFSKSIFNGETSFFRAKFFGNIRFHKITFNGVCNFLGAKFVGDAVFHGSKFKSFAKFGAGSKIFGNLDFSEVIFQEGAYLHDLEIGMKLKLARAQFENLMIRWPSIRDHLEDNWNSEKEIIRLVEDFDKSITPLYLSLIRNFNNIGFHDDADECYLELRRKKKKNIRDKKSQIIDYFDYALFGYGVLWYNPLVCGIFTMIFFLIFFFIFDDNCSINNYKAFSNATINSLASFVSSPKSDNIYIILFSNIERFFGYIIMSCFLVTLAKKRLR